MTRQLHLSHIFAKGYVFASVCLLVSTCLSLGLLEKLGMNFRDIFMGYGSVCCIKNTKPWG